MTPLSESNRACWIYFLLRDHYRRLKYSHILIEMLCISLSTPETKYKGDIQEQVARQQCTLSPGAAVVSSSRR